LNSTTDINIPVPCITEIDLPFSSQIGNLKLNGDMDEVDNVYGLVAGHDELHVVARVI
jgi:hypothetical protein